nr:hemin uptake protein HemP [Providencia sp. PROV194]
MALLLFDCENYLILAITLKIIILNIISIINKLSMVNNMTAPVAENTVETAKQPVKTDVIESQQLLGPAGKVSIQHNGELYQLRQTRTGKLILTK